MAKSRWPKVVSLGAFMKSTEASPSRPTTISLNTALRAMSHVGPGCFMVCIWFLHVFAMVFNVSYRFSGRLFGTMLVCFLSRLTIV